MLNGSEDSWDKVEGSAKAEPPSASEEALATVMLMGKTWDADTDAEVLQDQLGKLVEWHKGRKMAFGKAAECLNAEGQALISDAKKRSEVIVQDATKKAEAILAGAVEETKKWEVEKTALAGVQHFEPIVKLDVGGVRYTTSLTTLRRFPDTMIGCMFSGRHALPKEEDGYFFVDRDGTHFRHILNFLRSPEGYKVEVRGADARELRRECAYYGIDQLMVGVEKRLPYVNHEHAAQGSIAVLADGAGVLTIRDSGEEIEYCRNCHRGIFSIGAGAQRYCFPSFGTQSPPPAQPQVQGPCPICRQFGYA
jgi:hypothetical protein